MTTKCYSVCVEDTSVPVVIMYVYHYGHVGATQSLGRFGVAVRFIDS